MQFSPECIPFVITAKYYSKAIHPARFSVVRIGVDSPIGLLSYSTYCTPGRGQRIQLMTSRFQSFQDILERIKKKFSPTKNIPTTQG